MPGLSCQTNGLAGLGAAKEGRAVKAEPEPSEAELQQHYHPLMESPWNGEAAKLPVSEYEQVTCWFRVGLLDCRAVEWKFDEEDGHIPAQ